VRTMEDRQRFRPGGEVCDLRVRAGEVSPQEVSAGVDEERKVAHGQASLAVRDHGSKRVRLRMGEQSGAIVEAK